MRTVSGRRLRLASLRFRHRGPRLCCQFGLDGGKHAHPAPPLSTVIERLRRTVGGRRVLPHQPMALYEDYPAQYRPVINPRFTTGLRKERRQALSLCFCQPEKKALMIHPQFGKMKHDATPRSSSFTGHDCNSAVFSTSITTVRWMQQK
jgi:hypothetical protein